jgi:hypothetical protein
MIKFSLALLLLAVTITLNAADGFSSLEEQMTGQEFSEAGLDKLSQAELDSLNSWIRRHSVATLEPVKAAAVAETASVPAGDRRGFKDEDDRSPINSRIVGRFSGWDGQTTFKLENGMIWQQDDKDKFYIDAVSNPAVTIEPAMFGRWFLSVDGHDDDCKVRRIQ